MITAQIAKPYHFLIPSVYRYMDRKYIDEFFETGKIRLSSFKIYQKYEDTVKGDKGEGKNVVIAKSEKDNMTMYAAVEVGMNAYSLCTSTINSTKLMELFECDGVFRIKDSQSFGLAIANKVNSLLEGIQGHCIYINERKTKKDVDNLSLNELKVNQEGKELDMNKMFQKINEVNSIDSFFMKPLHYQDQSEYRFIWIVSENADNYLEIECKEAVQFCEKII